LAGDFEVSHTSPEEDFLQHDGGWGLFKTLNFALLLSIRPQKRAAIVTTIRNEGLCILEWIAHHRALGFYDFYVYTNNNTDSSLGLLYELKKCGIIKLIENEVGSGVAIQRKVFGHSLQMLAELRTFEWALYIDVDEFFVPRVEPGLDLDAVLSAVYQQFGSESPAAISFNWKWYGSQNAYDWSDNLVVERFQHCHKTDGVKSLVRLNDVISMSQVHFPKLFNGLRLVNSNFEEILPSCGFDPVYGSGQINHYWNKSFEEFVIKRDRGRTRPDAKQLDFSAFFNWGANSKIGDYDPLPNRILERTRRAYRELTSDRLIREELALVKQTFLDKLARIDQELNLKAVYRDNLDILYGIKQVDQ